MRADIEEVIKIIKGRKSGVRKENIIRLLRSLTSNTFRERDIRGYDIWFDSWILPNLKKLIPEVGDALCTKDDGGKE